MGRDWEGDPSTTIATRILSQLQPRGRNIVLQHDVVGNSPASISALQTVIARARHRGYCFVPLDEDGRPGFPTARVWVRATDTVEGRPALASVVLDRPASRETRVVLTTRSGTARTGRDFTASRATRVLTVPVVLRPDALDEAVEVFRVRVTAVCNARVVRDTALVRVVSH